jgi:hypothetical protein
MFHKTDLGNEAGIVSLDDFIGWLGTQNPDKSYNFDNNQGDCAMGRYMSARGLPWGRGLYGPTCAKVLHESLGFRTNELRVLAAKPQTFGAALERAKSLRNRLNARERVNA